MHNICALRTAKYGLGSASVRDEPTVSVGSATQQNPVHRAPERVHKRCSFRTAAVRHVPAVVRGGLLADGNASPTANRR